MHHIAFPPTHFEKTPVTAEEIDLVGKLLIAVSAEIDPGGMLQRLGLEDTPCARAGVVDSAAAHKKQFVEQLCDTYSEAERQRSIALVTPQT